MADTFASKNHNVEDTDQALLGLFGEAPVKLQTQEKAQGTQCCLSLALIVSRNAPASDKA